MGDNNQVTKTEFCVFVQKLLNFSLQASLLLRKQLAELNKNPVEGFSAGLIDDDDIYRWEVIPDYYGVIEH